MDHQQGRHVLIAANPKSGSRSRIDLIESLGRQLTNLGLEPSIISDLDALERQIRDLSAAKQLRAVVAAGGDGTVSTVAIRSPSSTPIAILPLGTENLLAKHLEIDRDVPHLAQSICDLKIKQLDCGLANGKLVLVMVGIGFDALVVEKMSQWRKGHINRWSYFVPIAKSVIKYRFPILNVSAIDENGQSVQWNARWAFVSNIPRYAASLPIAPWAVADDGALDVGTFRSGGVIRSLRYLAYLFMNRHKQLSAFRSLRITKLRIESNAPVPFQIDGDIGGMLPLEIEVLPKRICVVS